MFCDTEVVSGRGTVSKFTVRQVKAGRSPLASLLLVVGQRPVAYVCFEAKNRGLCPESGDPPRSCRGQLEGNNSAALVAGWLNSAVLCRRLYPDLYRQSHSSFSFTGDRSGSPQIYRECTAREPLLSNYNISPRRRMASRWPIFHGATQFQLYLMNMENGQDTVSDTSRNGRVPEQSVCYAVGPVPSRVV